MTESKGVRTVRHFRRARGDEGAAAVEFALLFPIFMILAMGTITAGTAFSRQINVTQAAREASRYGATLGIDAAGDMSAWLTAVDNAACRSASNGIACPTPAGTPDLNPVGGFNYRCVALITRDDLGNIVPAFTAYKVDGGSPVLNAAGGCPSQATPNLGKGSKTVQVILSRDVKFFIVFANPTLHLDGVSLTPYEIAFPA